MEYKMTRITRSGDRDLRGSMALIATADHGGNRGVTVQIYKLAHGGYVAHWYYWSLWQGERQWSKAQVAADAAQLLAALRDEDGELRAAERAAWDVACKRDRDLAFAECEVV